MWGRHRSAKASAERQVERPDLPDLSDPRDLPDLPDLRDPSDLRDPR